MQYLLFENMGFARPENELIYTNIVLILLLGVLDQRNRIGQFWRHFVLYSCSVVSITPEGKIGTIMRGAHSKK